MRALRHLLALPGAVARAFPPSSLKRIESAIAESERQHGCEIRFAVEAALDPLPLFQGQTARQRAIETFAELGVWDTEQNNGVLLYLLLADRDVEIVADRGFNGKVSAEQWETVCRAMESSLRAGRHENAVLEAIRQLTLLVAPHYPAGPGDRNELGDGAVRL